MSNYNTELQSNNTDLQTILDTINALPEAGSGGGTSVETCTVTITMTGIEPWGMLTNDTNYCYHWNRVNESEEIENASGKPTMQNFNISTITFECVCSSIISVFMPSGIPASYACEIDGNSELIYTYALNGQLHSLLLKAPSTSGSHIVAITIM